MSTATSVSDSAYFSSLPTSTTCSTYYISSSTRYQEAVRKLEALKSYATVNQRLKAEHDRHFTAEDGREQIKREVMLGTASCLDRLGIPLSRLDTLRVIHVSGTKGKTSTCAYTEAMLRSLGLKTGFFCSPHLMHVRERIQIDGQPLSEDEFADVVFAILDQLKAIPPCDRNIAPMPYYFMFLTVLAFTIFVLEKVDVAVVEVGLGGEIDPTNVMRSPVACAITTLDLDHAAVLGNCLKEIAWQKAGIFKCDAAAVVSSDQMLESMAVICERAAERKVASLSTAPALSAYVFPGGGVPRLGIDGEHQKPNIALALQLSRVWLRAARPQMEKQLWADETVPWCPGSAFLVPHVWVAAIQRCHFPGRSQIVERGSRHFFLDGAHTQSSMQSCFEWFRTASMPVNDENSMEDSGKRSTTLLLHDTGDRLPASLMQSLKHLAFDRVLLCPPTVQRRIHPSSDTAHYDGHKQSMVHDGRRPRSDMDASRVRRFECVSEALEYLQAGQLEEDVLVTGSLALVGSVLLALESFGKAPQSRKNTTVPPAHPPQIVILKY